MKKIHAIAAAVSIVLSGTVFAAAGPLTQSKSVSIDAPVAKVWAVAKDFGNLNSWHPALASDKIVAGSGNTVGTERLLTLKDGGTIHEKLLAFDDAGHSFKYSILEGVLPVSGYTSSFTVTAAGAGKSTVTWSGAFKRKDIGEHPSDKENDKAAIDTIGAVYQSGLDNLKQQLEAK